MKRALIALAVLAMALVVGWVVWPDEERASSVERSADASSADPRKGAQGPQSQRPKPAATASLRGIVVSQGLAVAHATVRLRSEAHSFELRSGEDGRFAFEGLPPDYYLLSAVHGERASEVHGPLLLSPVGVHGEVRLELLPAAAVSGVVADVLTRRPIPNATVRSSAGETRTDHAGRFRLGPLPPTWTWVEARAEGYGPRTEWLQVEGAREHGGMELFLRGSITLRGTVTRMGEPVAHAQVWAEKAQLATVAVRFGPVATDAEGAFELPVSSGEFQLAASGPSGARVAGPRVTVAEGGRYDGLNVELGQGLTARGTVLVDGRPFAQAAVTLLDARSQQVAAGAVTGAGGDFEVEGLAPGAYLAQVHAGALVAQRGPFELTGAGDAAWTLELDGEAPLFGRVEPAQAGVVVRARTTDWAGPLSANTLTDAEGRFTLAGFAAGAQVLVDAEVDGAWAQARAEVGEEVVLRLQSSAVVGYTVDAQGRAVTDFQVRVVPEAGGMPRSRPVLHPSGEFRVPVPPGRFRVEASSPGSGETEAPVQVEVPPGGDSPTVKLELSPVQPVEGVVLDAQTREPLAGVEVTVQRRAASQTFQFDRWLVVATDAEGRFRLGGVPRRAVLRFKKEGFREAWVAAERAGTLPEGRIHLQPEKRPARPFNQPYEGVGMQLRAEEDGTVFIGGVFDGSPAQAAGVASGDRLLAVEGASVTGVAVREIVARITGPSGTVVRLTLRRGTDTFQVAVRRRSIEL